MRPSIPLKSGLRERADPQSSATVAAGANMHEFGRFEIADEFPGTFTPLGAISGMNIARRQISI